MHAGGNAALSVCKMYHETSAQFRGVVRPLTLSKTLYINIRRNLTRYARDIGYICSSYPSVLVPLPSF